MKTLLLSISLLLASTSGAWALACKTYPTPDDARVDHTRVDKAGVSNLGGTAYTIGAFCPPAAAAGTCTGETLSERVNSTRFDWTTFDGDVPDNHRHGFYIRGHFVPVTPLHEGACGA